MQRKAYAQRFVLLLLLYSYEQRGFLINCRLFKMMNYICCTRVKPPNMITFDFR